MKPIFPLMVLLGLVFACQTKQTGESTTTDSAVADQTAAQVDALRPDTLNDPAAVSTSSSASPTPGQLDLLTQWAGTYAGTLPCADCNGIKTSLSLNADGSYSMQQTYLGKGDEKAKENKGQWTPSEDGSRIELDFNKPNERVTFRQGEGNTIKMLGRDGQEIDSKLNYSLTKQ